MLTLEGKGDAMPVSRRPTRREIIIVAVILSVFLILYYRNGNPPLEDQFAQSKQTDHGKHGKEESERRIVAKENRRRPAHLKPPLSPPLTERITPFAPEYSAFPKVNGILQSTRLIYKVDPIYPEELKGYNISGHIPLDITVDEKGTVAEVVVMARGDNVNQAFVKAAVAAVEKWLYEPALFNDIPARVSFGITITFGHNGTVGSIDSRRRVEPDPSTFITEYPGPMSFDPSRNYNNGRTYYTVTYGMTAPVIQVDAARLQSVAQAGLPPFDVFEYITIFINENGSVDGWLTTGAYNALIEEELKNIRVLSPAGFNGKAIPSWNLITINLSPDIS